MDEWETLKKSALFSEEDAVYLRLPMMCSRIKSTTFSIPGAASFSTTLICAPMMKTRRRQGRYRLRRGRAETFRPVGTRHREGQLRSDVARLPVRDRPAPSPHEEKSDGQRTYPRAYSRPRPARFLRLDCRSDEALSRQERPLAGNRQPHVRAWWKSMILQATLWIQPYIREGDF